MYRAEFFPSGEILEFSDLTSERFKYIQQIFMENVFLLPRDADGWIHDNACVNVCNTDSYACDDGFSLVSEFDYDVDESGIVDAYADIYVMRACTGFHHEFLRRISLTRFAAHGDKWCEQYSPEESEEMIDKCGHHILSVLTAD